MFTLTVIETADGKVFRTNDGRLLEEVMLVADDLDAGTAINLPDVCLDEADFIEPAPAKAVPEQEA